MRIVLGYPPSVAWRRKVLPWFSVRDLSACLRGAAVPLGSSVLRCSWSLRWGHLSQVGTVFFLSPRSWRRLSLLLVGLVPGLRVGSPASGWRCVLRHAFVLEAIPPHRLVLLLRTGFLFSGPGWCGRLQTFSFSYVFLRDVVTLWVNSVFLSLLIANEGLHWWLFLFRYSHPYWGRVVFIRPL